MMKVFLQETKKILRPLPLLILAVFTVIYAFVVLKEPYGWMTKYHNVCDSVAVSRDLIELCGPTLEPEELEGAVEILSERYIKELEQVILENPLFAKAGVTDYISFFRLENKIELSFLEPEMLQDKEYLAQNYPYFDIDNDYTLTPAEREICDQGLVFNVTAAIKYNTISNSFPVLWEQISFYKEAFIDELWGYNIPAFGKERIKEIHENDDMRNILPGYGIYHLKMFFPALAIMILLALCILLAPVITKDNMSGLISLQYSSKTGRKILSRQLAAVIFTAFIVALINIAAVFGFFIKTVLHTFLKSGLNSFTDPFSYSFFKGNFGQYLIAVSILIIVFSIASAMFIFFLSKLSKNYISLLLALVPTGTLLAALCYSIFKDPFAITSSGYQTTLYPIIPIPYVEVYIVAALFIIGIVLVSILLKKANKVEV